MKTVVIVEDAEETLKSLKSSLIEIGYHIVGEAKNAKEAFKLSMKLRPQVVILENILPDTFGINLMMKLKEAGLDTEFYMLSNDSQPHIIQIVKKLGAAGYIVKPFEKSHLLEVLNHVNDSVVAA